MGERRVPRWARRPPERTGRAHLWHVVPWALPWFRNRTLAACASLDADVPPWPVGAALEWSPCAPLQRRYACAYCLGYADGWEDAVLDAEEAAR